MKKIVTFLLLVVLCMSTFVGCGPKGSGGGGSENFANRPNKVSVVYFSSGYGDKWLEEVAKEYMTNYDTETYIEIKPTVMATEELEKISSGMAKDDLYLLEAHTEGVVEQLVELTDLYEQPALGEENTGKKIKDKVKKNHYEVYKDRNGKSYMMPYVNQLGYGWAYNKTTLDDAFGEDNYTIPRTTKEFFEMGDKLKDPTKNLDGKKKYLFVSALEDNSDYLVYSTKVWFAQLMGLENFDNFMEGMHFDATAGEYVRDVNAPTVISTYEQEIKDWYNIFRTLGSKSNGYIHAHSASINFIKSSEIFCGVPLDPDRAPEEVAFIFNGPWLENETDFIVEEQADYGDPQDIRAMKMPIASDIIKRTPTITSEEMLRNVVDYVDGILLDPPIGPSAEDIEKVAEARAMVGAVVTGTCNIPKVSDNIEGAKKFIRFLASDKAQLIAQQNIVGGLPLLPYGYIASEDELGFERSEYMKMVIERAEDARLIVSATDQYDFCYFGGFGFPHNQNYIIQDVFVAPNVESEMTAEKYYSNMYSTWQQKWEMMITNYNLAMGN